jgi:arylsulfatase A-like enzyme
VVVGVFDTLNRPPRVTDISLREGGSTPRYAGPWRARGRNPMVLTYTSHPSIMGPRRALLILCAALAMQSGCSRDSSAPPKGAIPFVLISIDTLRADRLNCYGYGKRKVSPNIDALARDGILFENHISAAPWTIPAHISLLTSLWPSNHGVTASLREIKAAGNEFPVLAPSRTTLAEILVAHGYSTAAFTAGDTLDPVFGYGQGFTLYRTNMLKLHAEPVHEMEEWVAEHGSEPFFLFWHTFECHAPYLGTRFLQEVLPSEQAATVRKAVERYAERLDHGEVQVGRFKSILVHRDVFELPVLEALYVGAVADTDDWVGVFLGRLRELGLYDRSLIVFTSDHGEEFADRSPDAFYNAHGHNLHREMVRVPLIVKLPAQEAAGTRVAALSRAVDVMPTALDVVGLPGTPQMQGTSLRPLWESDAPESRTVFVEALEDLNEEKAIQTERYKYTVHIGAESVAHRGRQHIPASPQARRLYDLENDPGETNDLLQGLPVPESERVAEELDRALREHLDEQRPDSRPGSIDAATVERLRQLGYVE